ncbi:hypothetical protein RAC69_08665 [Microbacterium sp. LS_15]|uniref:hypothetical protein n=1 Tax=Microbacterium sp. LS_15 TaxID=3055790 RepID=UPI0035C0046E
MTDKNPWAEVIGPCYTRTSLARALGWIEPEVATAATSLTVLELLTEDDVLLYPACQVWDGHVVPGLTEVLQVLSTGTASRWTWAQWLNTRPDDGHGGDEPSAIERLREDDLDGVLLEARHDAWAWSS